MLTTLYVVVHGSAKQEIYPTQLPLILGGNLTEIDSEVALNPLTLLFVSPATTAPFFPLTPRLTHPPSADVAAAPPPP